MWVSSVDKVATDAFGHTIGLPGWRNDSEEQVEHIDEQRIPNAIVNVVGASNYAFMLRHLDTLGLGEGARNDSRRFRHLVDEVRSEFGDN